jgi:hypothetical protein
MRRTASTSLDRVALLMSQVVREQARGREKDTSRLDLDESRAHSLITIRVDGSPLNFPMKFSRPANPGTSHRLSLYGAFQTHAQACIRNRNASGSERLRMRAPRAQKEMQQPRSSRWRLKCVTNFPILFARLCTL